MKTPDNIEVLTPDAYLAALEIASWLVPTSEELSRLSNYHESCHVGTHTAASNLFSDTRISILPDLKRITWAIQTDLVDPVGGIVQHSSYQVRCDQAIIYNPELQGRPRAIASTRIILPAASNSLVRSSSIEMQADCSGFEHTTDLITTEHHLNLTTEGAIRAHQLLDLEPQDLQFIYLIGRYLESHNRRVGPTYQLMHQRSVIQDSVPPEVIGEFFREVSQQITLAPTGVQAAFMGTDGHPHWVSLGFGNPQSVKQSLLAGEPILPLEIK